MSLIRKRLATIERELALGRREGPERKLVGLVEGLSPVELEAERESVLRLVHQFLPKRRERLLEILGSSNAEFADGGHATSRTALGDEEPTTNDALSGLSENEDGRIPCWEIERFRKRVSSRAAALDVIREQIELHRRAGDTLGTGEWSLTNLFYVAGSPVSDVVAETLAAWSSPRGMIHHFEDLASLIRERAVFVEGDLAAALGAMSLRFQDHQVPLPRLVSDLAFKIKEALAETLGIRTGRKPELCPSAAASVSTERASLEAAAESFVASGPGTAKEAAIALIKRARAFQRLALVAERPLLIEIPLLVGVEFRKLCEDYQRRDTDGMLHRVPGVREHATALLGRSDDWGGSRLWHDVVQVVAKKVVNLADDVLAGTQAATSPHLGLASTLFKVDLTTPGRTPTIMARLLNQGPGRAQDVELSGSFEDVPVSLRIVEPRASFDVGGQSEQLLRIEAVVDAEIDSVTIPIQWSYRTPTGVNKVQEDTVQLIQQIGQPDWEKLSEHPPYSHNAVKERKDLFGRDDILQNLALNSMAGNSCFVWGQKRIGKTSVLQVLAGELRQRTNVACVYLRMGEIKGLHEGQLAHRVAERLAGEMHLPVRSVPDEGHFGASMARLIPWVEGVARDRPSWRLVLIIDEFDDLDPAYYTGQRGEKFVKQLRSLSEVGLTFLLVGSERMERIFRRHENELNKWDERVPRLDRVTCRL